MPFIGQDWRSPGEVWIKTDEGWERMKLLLKSHLIRSQSTANNNNNKNSLNTDGSGKKSSGISQLVVEEGVEVDEEEVVLSGLSKSPITVSVPASGAASAIAFTNRNSCGSTASLSSTGTSLSSSPTSSVDSSLDSDSDGELLITHQTVTQSQEEDLLPGTSGTTQSVSIPIFESASPSPSSSQPCHLEPGDENEEQSSKSVPSVVEIIQRLQKSSSQPIPMEILQESSILIESHQIQPYCRVTLNPTREVAGSNIISDAFLKLDFCNAIRDIRRFSYVTKLLHLLITQNLTTLSGNATKALFWMLEEIAKQVATKKQNIHVIRDLLVELRQIVKMNLCWGRPLGSTILWDQHLRTMERICEMTDNIEIKPPEDSTKPQWSELPEELIREILLRLSNYKDLERSAEACERMQSLLNEEQHIWKQLCKYHFSNDQRKWAFERAAATGAPGATGKNSIFIDSEPDGNGNLTVNWERTFHLLRKKFGLKEEYADCLFLCRYCRCLFWKSKGHPCILENPDLTRQQLSVTGATEQSNRSNHPSKSSILSSSAPTPAPSRAAAILQGVLQSGGNRHRHLSNPSGVSAAVPAPAPAPPSPEAPQVPGPLLNLRQQLQHQNHQLRRFQPPLQLPIVVQNFPFFEHPLVLQQQRRSNNQNVDNDNNAEPAAAAVAQVQDGAGPNANQNQAENNNLQPAAAAAPSVDNNNDTTTHQQRNSFKKAPLHVPITPEEFLKFFSL